MTKTLLRTGAAIAALTVAAPAMAEEITMIVCGDTMDPIHDKYIAEWEAQNEGWTVAPEVVGWGQCQDKVTTLAVAGTPVGLAYVGSRTLKEFAEFGLIEPIPMTDEEKASYYPNVVGTVTYQGQQWGVPVAFSTKALYWNKDLFAEAGLDPETPPATWDDVIAAAKAVTENTDAAGFGLVAKTFDNTMHQFLHWVYTNNGQVIDDEGNIVLDSPEVLAALEAYKTLVPYSEEGPTAYEQNEVRAIFLDGGVSMIHASIGAVSRLQDTDINWGVANLPLGPEAKGPGTLLITDSLAVFSGTGVEEQAISLAKFLTAPAAQEEYDLNAGLTPLRPSPTIDALVEEKPYWAPYIEGIEYGGPEPLFTDYRAFQNIMIEMVQSVVTGDAEPAEALAKADAELKELE
ncbi:carbohydrate ABC transporter substrate-binding protein, CUT1 family [Pseudooceanicola antarcticus]|uniref:ABC transporter substrate-binding protein n=1 Tax=Pseudooceanicola antarcticus TaxID=1247613 RepID=A0A285IK86_9RHOB|nr:extracellular solute-binding protein [Pseudooceanicola antarcticus]PJE28811.1 ABC transporter substrate-binding protein [Pseudooceanicola antarcticus]SNY48167.1 carbohydrate ABC transporter substrate-binding protein, CUT1 family [Pseudooceanicola antarcticus]